MRVAWCALAIEHSLRSVSVLPGGQVAAEAEAHAAPDMDDDVAALQANMRMFAQKPEQQGALSRAAIKAQESVKAEARDVASWGDGVIAEHQKEREARAQRERARYLAAHGESSGLIAPDTRLDAAAKDDGDDIGVQGELPEDIDAGDTELHGQHIISGARPADSDPAEEEHIPEHHVEPTDADPDDPENTPAPTPAPAEDASTDEAETAETSDAGTDSGRLDATSDTDETADANEAAADEQAAAEARRPPLHAPPPVLPAGADQVPSDEEVGPDTDTGAVGDDDRDATVPGVDIDTEKFQKKAAKTAPTAGKKAAAAPKGGRFPAEMALDPAEMALQWAKAPGKAAASWDSDMKATWHPKSAAGPEYKPTHHAHGGPGGGPDLPPDAVNNELKHGQPSDYARAAAQADGLEWPPKTPCYVNPAPLCSDGSNAVCCNVECAEKATCCGSFCCDGRFFCSHDLDRAIAERGHVCWGPNVGKRELKLFAALAVPAAAVYGALRATDPASPAPLPRLPLLDAALVFGALHFVTAHFACGASPLLQPQACSGQAAWFVSLGRLWVVPFFVAAGFLHKQGNCKRTLAKWYVTYLACALVLALADAPQLDAATRAKPAPPTWLSLLPATADDGSSAWVYAQRLWWFLRRALLLDTVVPFGEDSGLWLFPALVGLQAIGEHCRVPAAKAGQVALFTACWLALLFPILAVTATGTVTPDPLLQSLLRLPLVLWPLYVAGMAARALAEDPDWLLGGRLLAVGLVLGFLGHAVAQKTPEGLEDWDLWQGFYLLPLACALCAAATQVRAGFGPGPLASCAAPLYLLHSPVAHLLFIAAAWTPPTFRLFALCLLLAAGGQAAASKPKAELA